MRGRVRSRGRGSAWPARQRCGERRAAARGDAAGAGGRGEGAVAGRRQGPVRSLEAGPRAGAVSAFRENADAGSAFRAGAAPRNRGDVHVARKTTARQPQHRRGGIACRWRSSPSCRRHSRRAVLTVQAYCRVYGNAGHRLLLRLRSRLTPVRQGSASPLSVESQYRAVPVSDCRSWKRKSCEESPPAEQRGTGVRLSP